MRAARAGLILTPHWINELVGPTSVGRQEARPLVWLPILRLCAVGPHGGATAELLGGEQRPDKRTAVATKSLISFLFVGGGQILSTSF